MDIKEKIELFKKQYEGKSDDTIVDIFLESGEKLVGTVKELKEDYIILDTLDGQITIFDFFGFQVSSPENQDSEGDILSKTATGNNIEISEMKVQNLNKINDFLEPFQVDLPLKLKINPIKISFPAKIKNLSLDKRKEMEKIISRIHYALKMRNHSALESLANDLLSIGKKTPLAKEILLYTGYVFYKAKNYKMASKTIFTAYKQQKKPEILFNYACANLKRKNYDNAYKALHLYFSRISPSSTLETWIIFCRLIKLTQNYKKVEKLYDKIFGESSKISECERDFQLFYKAIIYLLRENRKMREAIKIIDYIENESKQEIESRVVQKLKSFIISYIEPLSELEIKSSEEKVEIDKKTPKEVKLSESTIVKSSEEIVSSELKLLKGFIYEYKKNRNFGFIGIDNVDDTYYFNLKEINDESLVIKLKSEVIRKIPVYFRIKKVQKGPQAINIFSVRPIEEIFNLATEYYENGNYKAAITQIINVLSLDKNFPKANEFYQKWRLLLKESLKVHNIPLGSNSYARAKRADLIEKNSNKAESLYRDAIRKKDHYESAVKDLAHILDRLKRPNEAVNLLEKHKFRITNKKSIDQILINLYQKVRNYDKSIELLKKINNDTINKEMIARNFYRIGNLYLKNKDYRNSEKNFKEILKLYPQSIVAKRSVALCLSKQEKYVEAEELLNRIITTSTDRKAEKLLEAIQESKNSGATLQVEDIIIEFSSVEFSIVDSKFATFYLNNCEFLGVEPGRIEKDEDDRKIYVGTEVDAKFDLTRLEDAARTFTTRNPHERSSFYLSAARISLDTRGDTDEFFKFLGRSFTSRGDASIKNKRSKDTVRTWYIESLISYDKVENSFRKEKDSINALIRYLESTIEKEYIRITPKVPTIEEALIETFEKSKNVESLFNAIGYLISYSQNAAKRVITFLYNKVHFKSLALDYLEKRGFHNLKPEISKKKFEELWNNLIMKTLDQLGKISKEIQYITHMEFSTAWLEHAIKRIKVIFKQGYFRLDQERIYKCQQILQIILEYCKKNTFGDRERLLIQINDQCSEFLNEIKDVPTKFSIEEIYTIIKAIREKIKKELDYLYENSMPQITLRMLEHINFYPKAHQEIEVPLIIENKEWCSPAEDLELRVLEDPKFFRIETSIHKLEESLKGGDRKTLLLQLRITEDAVEAQTFSLTIQGHFHSKLKKIEKIDKAKFTINIYPESEFEPIDNPFASYAEGDVVDNPEMFFGREELIENVTEALLKSRKQNKCIIFFGQKRSGKSSILYHLKKTLEKRKNVLIIDLENIGDHIDKFSRVPFTYQILWSILEKLQEEIHIRGEKEYPSLDLSFPTDIEFYDNPTPIKYFVRLFENYLRDTYKKKKWKIIQNVLIIDEFSYIYDQITKGNIPDDFMKNWKAILQRNFFSAVLAGQDVMEKFKQKFPNEFGTTQDERVSYLNKKHARELIDRPIRIPPFTIEGESRFREGAIERIINLTAGSPYYIQIICNRLVEYMNQNRLMYVSEPHIDHIRNELIIGVNAFKIGKFDNLINSGDESENAISDEDIISVLRDIAKNSRTGPCNRFNIKCVIETPIDEILKDLINRDVIKRVREDFYEIRVGLFKEWLIINM